MMSDETNVERQLTVRKLGFGDVFPMSKILKKINLKIDASEIANKINPEDLKKPDALERVGLLAILPIIHQALENIHLAESEVNDFLGSLVGMSGKDFSQLSLEEGIFVIGQLARQKQVASFLKSAGR
jgi:hypothetical protein